MPHSSIQLGDQVQLRLGGAIFIVNELYNAGTYLSAIYTDTFNKQWYLMALTIAVQKVHEPQP